MDEIAFLPAHAALAKIHAGELSSRQVVQAALDQIAKLDSTLRGFITVRAEEVLHEAAAMDERYARGEIDEDEFARRSEVLRTSLKRSPNA